MGDERLKEAFYRTSPNETPDMQGQRPIRPLNVTNVVRSAQRVH